MENEWKYIGMIKDRIRVYQGGNGEYTVNRDDDALYFPTDEELEEIHLTYGSKEVKREKGVNVSDNEREQMVDHLTKTIVVLREDAQKRENIITSMQIALKARDEMSNDLINDRCKRKRLICAGKNSPTTRWRNRQNY